MGYQLGNDTDRQSSECEQEQKNPRLSSIHAEFSQIF